MNEVTANDTSTQRNIQPSCELKVVPLGKSGRSKPQHGQRAQNKDLLHRKNRPELGVLRFMRLPHQACS